MGYVQVHHHYIIRVRGYLPTNNINFNVTLINRNTGKEIPISVVDFIGNPALAIIVYTLHDLMDIFPEEYFLRVYPYALMNMPVNFEDREIADIVVHILEL